MQKGPAYAVTLAKSPVGSRVTLVCCPECAKAGRPVFERRFYGRRRICPDTLKEECIDVYNLPTLKWSMSQDEAILNTKSLSAFSAHYRQYHPQIKYRVSQATQHPSF